MTPFKGGHTIVRTLTDKTYCTPAASDRASCRFSLAETAIILDVCKRQRLTFGAVMNMLKADCAAAAQEKKDSSMTDATWADGVEAWNVKNFKACRALARK